MDRAREPAQGLQCLTGTGVPEPYRAVDAARREATAVGAIGHGMNRTPHARSKPGAPGPTPRPKAARWRHRRTRRCVGRPGCKATPQAPLACAFERPNSAPEAASQSLTVPSWLAEASRLPSALYASRFIAFECPRRVRTS